MEQSELNELLAKEELSEDDQQLLTENWQQVAAAVMDSAGDGEPAAAGGDPAGDEDPTAAGDEDPDPGEAAAEVTPFPYPSMLPGGKPGKIGLGLGDGPQIEDDEAEVGAEADDEPADVEELNIPHRGSLSYDTMQAVRRSQRSRSAPEREKGTLDYPSMRGMTRED